MITVEVLAAGLRRRYPRWPESVCAEIAEAAVGWYVEPPVVVGTAHYELAELLARFTSNDGVLLCLRCRTMLGDCDCRCTPGCGVPGCGFEAPVGDTHPLQEVVDSIAAAAGGKRTVPDGATPPLVVEAMTLVDGHHRLAALSSADGPAPVPVVVVRGESARQQAWNRLCVLHRPRCATHTGQGSKTSTTTTVEACSRCGLGRPGDYCPWCGERRLFGLDCPRCGQSVDGYCPACGERRTPPAA